MTILHGVTERISGQILQGHRISCAEDRCNHCTNFFPDTKHLPMDVVANKFRQRQWEVNSDGRDYCPDCVSRRRDRKKNRGGVAAAVEKTLYRDQVAATPQNIMKVMSGIGFAPHEVIELEHPRDRKFKITWKNVLEIQPGRLGAAESEILASLHATRLANILKIELKHTIDKGVITIEPMIHWYLTLEIKKVVPLRPALTAAE